METKVAFLLRDNSVLEQALDRSRACHMEAVHQNIKLQLAMQKEEEDNVLEEGVAPTDSEDSTSCTPTQISASQM